MNSRIIRKENLMTTKHLNLVFATWETKKGKTSEWVYAERPGLKNAVVIAAITEGPDPKLVVTREYRPPLDGYEWGLPAGLIDEGESIERTVIRELKEETGLDVVEFLKPISPLVYNSPGMSNEGCYMAYVSVSGNISQDYLKDNEDISTFLMDKSQISNLIQSLSNPNSQENMGAKAFMVFDRFIEHGDI